jgi:hypothetical protein
MNPDPRRAAKRVRAQRRRLTDRVSRLTSPSGRQLASVGRQSSWWQMCDILIYCEEPV